MTVRAWRFFMVMFLLPTLVGGQSLWLNPDRANSISAEVLKVGVPTNTNFTFVTTGAWTINCQVAITHSVLVVGELPLTMVEEKNEATPSDSESVIGNPYLGVKLTLRKKTIALEFGIRPPITEHDKPAAVYYGLLSDLDRFGAYRPDTLTIKARFEYISRSMDGFFIRGRCGPTVVIPTGDGDANALDVLFGVGTRFGLQADEVRIWGGANTLAGLTDFRVVGRDRLAIEIGFGASLVMSSVELGLLLRLPLTNDYRKLVSNVIGFTFTLHAG